MDDLQMINYKTFICLSRFYLILKYPNAYEIKLQGSDGQIC
jgi:hypothetical protein